MNKKLIAVAVAGALALPSVVMAEEAAPASPLSFNVGVVSDYLFRGISQTHGKPAIQAGIDYAHPSGFYIGAWGSTITWVKDALGSGGTEIDVYGGYKNTFGGGDWSYDVGYITYNYPSHGDAIQPVMANPNTQEIYAALGYKWLSAKYSHVTSSHFVGWYGANSTAASDQSTRGSGYLELNANYDLGDGWTLIGHAGHQKVKNLGNASYTDWKFGAGKDVGFGTVSLVYSDTNAKGSCSNAEAYCWGTNKGTQNFKDVSKGVAVLSFTKTF